MEKISFVCCPRCKKEFYIERADYIGKRDAICHCPFCAHQFKAQDGSPRPPLNE